MRCETRRSEWLYTYQSQYNFSMTFSAVHDVIRKPSENNRMCSRNNTYAQLSQRLAHSVASANIASVPNQFEQTSPRRNGTWFEVTPLWACQLYLYISIYLYKYIKDLTSNNKIWLKIYLLQNKKIRFLS